jgi:hypothetical protein
MPAAATGGRRRRLGNRCRREGLQQQRCDTQQQECRRDQPYQVICSDDGKQQARADVRGNK